MSGEMCTSLGNGFSNKMLMNYVCHSKGGTCFGYFEGDDGLVSSTVRITSEDFLRCGFDIKILEHNDLLTTGFCGLTMASDGSAMADPSETLLNFGWTHSPMMRGGYKVRMGLLRAKAMSLLYQQPNCPILSKFAMHYVKLTEGYNPRFDTGWWDIQMSRESQAYFHWAKSEANKGVSGEARSAFEDLYGISAAQQLAIERKIDSYGMTQISDPILLNALHFNDDCAHYYHHYVEC